VNHLVKHVIFYQATAKHVNEMMLRAFPFIANTGYVPLKNVKNGSGKAEIIKVENRYKNLDLIKE
jgi:hypothetical protein